MEKSVEMQAASVELAIEKALEELGVAREKTEIEVLAKGGLFSKAKVRVTVKETVADKLAEFVNGILEKMGTVCRATAEDRDGTIYINIEGEDSSVAIGHRGEVLDAFQYLALTYLNENKAEFKKVVIDAENYRQKRTETLTELAERLAQKAVRLRRKIALEPMNPFERRVIHSALSGNEAVTTVSEGEDPYRHVIIAPVGVELKDPRPLKCGENDRNSGRSDSRRGKNDRRDRDRRRNERRYDSRDDETEVEDGNVYRGYLGTDGFKKPTQPSGPPKFKSFGGKQGRR